MDRVEIPNQATYSPVALTDVFIAAPLVSRVLLGATLPGRMLQAVAFGAYAGSALADWIARQDAVPVDLADVLGTDPAGVEPLSDEERRAEVAELVADLNARYEPLTLPRDELARLVNERLTDYLASLTGQRVETSSEVRSFSLAKLVFPFALGACDVLSGDVALFRETGIFEPHVIAHEFCHRKGYIRELEAQVLAYMALSTAPENVLVQAAHAERLHRHLRVLAGEGIEAFHREVDECGLRAELTAQFHGLRPPPSAWERGVWTVMKPLYEQRMKMTGQGGLSDYDRGFTDFVARRG
ncbi:MAG: hypothetical protein D6701_12240 [Gemmatimonadetes bacterium]|nr:MAG: hypothetical protein D6701_12240 [Gemmatimonadota bacterium]